MTTRSTDPARTCAVQKGELVALHYLCPATFLASGRPKRSEWEMAQVVSVTRDGHPKVVAEVGLGGSTPRVPIDRLYGLVGWVALGHADTADIALAAARAHHYPGHPRQPQPYGSLEELRLVVEDAALAGST